MKHNLSTVLRHLEAAEASPWAQTYIKDMIDELKKKKHKIPILLTMRGENRIINEIIGR